MLTSFRLEAKFSMFVNKPQSYLAYKRQNIKPYLKFMKPLSTRVSFA